MPVGRIKLGTVKEWVLKTEKNSQGGIMTREEAIDHIYRTYPIDADFQDTAEIGKRLLEQAKRDTEHWRNLPDAVLLRYAYLCLQEESKWDARK